MKKDNLNAEDFRSLCYLLVDAPDEARPHVLEILEAEIQALRSQLPRPDDEWTTKIVDPISSELYGHGRVLGDAADTLVRIYVLINRGEPVDREVISRLAGNIAELRGYLSLAAARRGGNRDQFNHELFRMTVENLEGSPLATWRRLALMLPSNTDAAGPDDLWFERDESSHMPVRDGAFHRGDSHQVVTFHTFRQKYYAQAKKEAIQPS